MTKRIDSLTFRTPVPVSTKNSRMLGRRGGRMFSIKTPKQRDCLDRIAADAISAIELLGLSPGPDNTVFGSDSVEVRIVHDVQADEIEVMILRMGPKPPRTVKSGRKRDLQNLQEAVCDALQKLAFDNDNQIDVMRMRRKR